MSSSSSTPDQEDVGLKQLALACANLLLSSAEYSAIHHLDSQRPLLSPSRYPLRMRRNSNPNTAQISPTSSSSSPTSGNIYVNFGAPFSSRDMLSLFPQVIASALTSSASTPSSATTSTTSFLSPTVQSAVIHPFELYNCKNLPTITPMDYFERMTKYLHCSHECYIYALVLLRRFCEESVKDLVSSSANSHGLGGSPNTSSNPHIDLSSSGSPQLYCLTPRNVYRLWLVACVAAIKVRDDIWFPMKYYACVGGINVHELKALEIHFYTQLRWSLHVTSSDYVQMLNALSVAGGDIHRFPLIPLHLLVPDVPFLSPSTKEQHEDFKGKIPIGQRSPVLQGAGGSFKATSPLHESFTFLPPSTSSQHVPQHREGGELGGSGSFSKKNKSPQMNTAIPSTEEDQIRRSKAALSQAKQKVIQYYAKLHHEGQPQKPPLPPSSQNSVGTSPLSQCTPRTHSIGKISPTTVAGKQFYHHVRHESGGQQVFTSSGAASSTSLTSWGDSSHTTSREDLLLSLGQLHSSSVVYNSNAPLQQGNYCKVGYSPQNCSSALVPFPPLSSTEKRDSVDATQ